MTGGSDFKMNERIGMVPRAARVELESLSVEPGSP